MKYHTIKKYEEWRYSSTMLDFSTVWRWFVSFMIWARYPWERCP
jgi:hypothetical protein